MVKMVTMMKAVDNKIKTNNLNQTTEVTLVMKMVVNRLLKVRRLMKGF